MYDDVAEVPQHEECMMMLQRYHNMKRINDAARVLTTMFKTRPSLINSEGMDLLLVWVFAFLGKN